MLVHLLKLPPVAPLVDELKGKGIHVRRAQPFEQSAVRRFVESSFAVTWADEISVAYARQPVSLFIASATRFFVPRPSSTCAMKSSAVSSR